MEQISIIAFGAPGVGKRAISGSFLEWYRYLSGIYEEEPFSLFVTGQMPDGVYESDQSISVTFPRNRMLFPQPSPDKNERLLSFLHDHVSNPLSGRDSFCRELFRQARLILLVTDSTRKNSVWTKEQIATIREWNSSAHLLAIANKQDLVDCYSPQEVAEILGIDTVGYVGIDNWNRRWKIALTEAIGEKLGLKTDTLGQNGDWSSKPTGF